MKLKIFFIISFCSTYLFTQNSINIDSLIIDNGIYKNNNLPFYGMVFNLNKNKKFNMGKLINGKKNDLWIEWHPHEKRLQETYKNGLLDGSVSLFLKNGQKEWRYTYSLGILDGLYTKWHQNGQKAVEGFFENGNAVGNWWWWDRNGKMIKKEQHKKRTKGIPIQYKQYIYKENNN